MLLAVVTGVTALCVAHFRRKSHKPLGTRRAETLVQEGSAEEVGAIGTWLDVLYGKDDWNRGAAVKALAAALPLLAPGDRAALSDRDYRRILRLLGEPDESLVRAALAALCAVGGEEALGPIRRLVSRSSSQPVREMAASCADAIRARLTSVRTSMLPLRPASASSDTLLRPSGSSASRDDSLLVRPYGD